MRMMHKRRTIGRPTLAASMIAGTMFVLAFDAGARAGQAPKAVTQCQGCHGSDGMGNAAAGFPALAGLPQKYLARQMWAFAHGVPHNSPMVGISKGVDPKSRRHLSAYYAKLPVKAPKSLPAPPKTDLGKTIALNGLHSGTPKAVPACNSCHGAGGLGRGEFPRLAGQPASYLAGQLKDWQNGSRKDALMYLMRRISDKLSAKDVKAVAAYYASLSPNPGAGQAQSGSNGKDNSGAGGSGAAKSGASGK